MNRFTSGLLTVLDWIGGRTCVLVVWAVPAMGRLINQVCFSSGKRTAITLLIAGLVGWKLFPTAFGPIMEPLLTIVIMVWAIWWMASFFAPKKRGKKKPATP